MEDGLDLHEMQEWLENHADTPPVPCLLCDEPVGKDTVIDHLIDKHEHWQVALLMALLWFVPEEDDALEREGGGAGG